MKLIMHKKIKVISNKYLFHFIKGKNEIRLSNNHKRYVNEILYHFDYYFNSIIPSKSGINQICDFSKASWHNVKYFPLMPIFFPSVSEPVITAKKYIDFANLSKHSVVIDLGAYSGLTSILLDQVIINKKINKVSEEKLGGGVDDSNKKNYDGFVIAVEADRFNIEACIKNFSLYKKITNRNIYLLKSAIWDKKKKLLFSHESNMGSSATNIVGKKRGYNSYVSTITLMTLVNRFKLKKVDFIKCDIEGAEVQALNAPVFFSKFKPKIIIECHNVKGFNTLNTCKKMMENFGYTCKVEKQKEYSHFPFLFCY
jgi:FkbM family methyltransferase